MVMPHAGEGVDGGPARYKHGWKPVSPEVTAAVERIRAARARAKPGPKGTPMAHTRVLPALSNSKDYKNMSPADKIDAAEIMYGTGSRQHKQAIARFSPQVTASSPPKGPAVKDYAHMSPADKIAAAATMYGTGSRQHKEAQARFSPKVTDAMDRIRKSKYPPRHPTSLGESVTPNVAELTAEARGGGRPYSAAHMTPDGRFTPEREAVHRQIIEQHLAGIKPTGKQPVQYMNGGGPGSGKSTLRAGDNAKLTGYPDTREVNELTGEVDLSHPAQAVLIDPDAVKMMLPEVKAARARGETDWAARSHEESSYLAKRIHQAALDRGLDLVYDGTGDSGPHSVENKVAKARASGYRLEANYIYLDPNEGVRRAGVRAQRTGRHVPEAYIRETYSDVAKTFDALAKQGTFDVLRVFDNNQARGVPAKPIAEFQGARPKVHNPAAYRRFLVTGGIQPGGPGVA